jgi:hypothetical protein
LGHLDTITYADYADFNVLGIMGIKQGWGLRRHDVTAVPLISHAVLAPEPSN